MKRQSKRQKHGQMLMESQQKFKYSTCVYSKRWQILITSVLKDTNVFTGDDNMQSSSRWAVLSFLSEFNAVIPLCSAASDVCDVDVESAFCSASNKTFWNLKQVTADQFY